MSGDLTARDAEAVLIEVVGLQMPPGWVWRPDAVLAALAAAGWRLERDDQWEWGYRKAWPNSAAAIPVLTETLAREVVARSQTKGQEGWQVIRRISGRPAGEWEVAP